MSRAGHRRRKRQGYMPPIKGLYRLVRCGRQTIIEADSAGACRQIALRRWGEDSPPYDIRPATLAMLQDHLKGGGMVLTETGTMPITEAFKLADLLPLNTASKGAAT